MNLGAHIVNHYELYFDAADKANGSLYLAAQPSVGTAAIEATIARLRNAGLWSDEPYKVVPAAQRAAYAEQMQFAACVQFNSEGIALLATRYTHPKYPSSSERWTQWVNALTA